MSLDERTSDTIQFMAGAVVVIVFIVSLFSLNGPPEKVSHDGKECYVLDKQLYCEVDKE